MPMSIGVLTMVICCALGKQSEPLHGAIFLFVFCLIYSSINFRLLHSCRSWELMPSVGQNLSIAILEFVLCKIILGRGGSCPRSLYWMPASLSHVWLLGKVGTYICIGEATLFKKRSWLLRMLSFCQQPEV